MHCQRICASISGERIAAAQMGEAVEVINIPATSETRVVSTPPSTLHAPSSTPSQLEAAAPPPPTQFVSCPFANSTRKALVHMQGYLEEVGYLTKIDPQDAWLPITESRNGNTLYAAFHTLSAGIGAPALILPVAFTFLGWTWGIISLSVAFCWQLYTLWILTQLHESVGGARYSRYVHLAKAAFGDKMGAGLTKVPAIYLSSGTCVALIVIGGKGMKQFCEIVCGTKCERSQPLTTIEWYLVFVCLAVVLAQLPNLNSVAGVSLIGATTAIGYCTLIWVLSVTKGRDTGVTYNPLKPKPDIARVFGILNSLGIIAFAFRGHNVTLEIQGTMSSTVKQPSRVPMWKGVKIAYLLIALCLYPIAVGGYWAYGNMIPSSGILTALNRFHGHDTSTAILGLTSLLVVMNCLCSFQVYAMPVFDILESAYTSSKNRRCPPWLRSGFRAFYGAIAFLVAVALPFLPSLAGLIGGIALPITFSYPCFMWIILEKRKRRSMMWYINWLLGCLGMALSALVVAGALWSIVRTGLKVQFFKAQ